MNPSHTKSDQPPTPDGARPDAGALDQLVLAGSLSRTGTAAALGVDKATLPPLPETDSGRAFPFLAHHSVRIDAHNNIRLPAAYRTEISGDKVFCSIDPVCGQRYGLLLLFPEPNVQWANRVLTSIDPKPEVAELLYRFFTPLPISGNSIHIPTGPLANTLMAQSGSMPHEVVIAGFGRYLGIWSPEGFVRFEAEHIARIRGLSAAAGSSIRSAARAK
jgi:DNA-binding transcriptional regulator/RsmH inhibitor MraZ